MLKPALTLDIIFTCSLGSYQLPIVNTGKPIYRLSPCPSSDLSKTSRLYLFHINVLQSPKM